MSDACTAEEGLLYVLPYLTSLKDLLALEQVCKRLRGASREVHATWQHLGASGLQIPEDVPSSYLARLILQSRGIVISIRAGGCRRAHGADILQAACGSINLETLCLPRGHRVTPTQLLEFVRAHEAQLASGGRTSRLWRLRYGILMERHLSPQGRHLEQHMRIDGSDAHSLCRMERIESPFCWAPQGGGARPASAWSALAEVAERLQAAWDRVFLPGPSDAGRGNDLDSSMDSQASNGSAAAAAAAGGACSKFERQQERQPLQGELLKQQEQQELKQQERGGPSRKLPGVQRQRQEWLIEHGVYAHKVVEQEASLAKAWDAEAATRAVFDLE
eukprot:jgi/Mesen1/7376/ME000382S06577